MATTVSPMTRSLRPSASAMSVADPTSSCDPRTRRPSPATTGDLHAERALDGCALEPLDRLVVLVDAPPGAPACGPGEPGGVGDDADEQHETVQPADLVVETQHQHHDRRPDQHRDVDPHEAGLDRRARGPARRVPRISRMLAMLEPTTLPRAMSPAPASAARALTTSSGALVPKATMVSPTTSGPTPRRRASAALPRTSPSAPRTSRRARRSAQRTSRRSRTRTLPRPDRAGTSRSRARCGRRAATTRGRVGTADPGGGRHRRADGAPELVETCRVADGQVASGIENVNIRSAQIRAKVPPSRTDLHASPYRGR